MMEEWKDIEGFEGLYQVSNHGRVRSYTRIQENGVGRIYESRIMNQRLTKFGYYKVHLCKHGKSYYLAVHRLVAKAFVYNPNGYTDVNHKDEIKTNNHADNLEWCTKSYNNNYGTRNKRLSVSLKGSEYITNKKRKVYQYTTDGVLLNVFPSSTEAAESIGTLSSSIRNACRKHQTLHGYVWCTSEVFIPPVKRGNYKINKARFKSVAQYDQNMNLLMTYDSVTDAEKATGFDRHKIAKCCKGIKYCFHGYVWKYITS